MKRDNYYIKVVCTKVFAVAFDVLLLELHNYV